MLFFTVAPVCRPGQETVQGVGRREAAKVVCEVEANPSDKVHYTWRFNNSRETVDLTHDRFIEEGSRSTAAYTPLTPMDYGTLMCWASNEFGKQIEPCVYQVIAAGKWPIVPFRFAFLNNSRDLSNSYPDKKTLTDKRRHVRGWACGALRH